MAEENDKTRVVLEWLKQAMMSIYENPSRDNIQALVSEVLENKEVVSNAILDALKPEFREMGEAISGFMVPGIRTDEKDMVRTNE